MNKRILCAFLAALVIFAVSGCSDRKMGVFTDDQPQGSPPQQYVPPATDAEEESAPVEESESTSAENNDVIENSFVDAEENNVSQVSVSASKSSYSYFRDVVNGDYTLKQLQMCSYDFKIEEFLNYFEFSSNEPSEGNVFGLRASLVDCPWSSESALLRLTLKTREVEYDGPHNFVFYIDISESMAREDVLPLFKTVFSGFASQLDEDDIISIVVGSDTEETVADGYSGERADELLEAVNAIQTVSGANSQYNLEKAYEVALTHYIDGGNNRVIIVSDGDVSGKLSAVVSENAESGILTSVIGLGDGNHKNDKLEALADAGDGRYYYIDCEAQGERVMGSEIFKPVICDATNVIAKLEFDVDYISQYRLIGYVQQGDGYGGTSEELPPGKIYAGDSLTLCYELKFVDGVIPEDLDFLFVQAKYNDAVSGKAGIDSFVVSTAIYSDEPDEEERFMALVIETVMILQKSAYIGKITFSDVLAELETLDLENYPEREEFRGLVNVLAGKK